MLVDTFTGRIKSPYVACDIETHTYVDGEIIPDAKIRQMCAQSKREKGHTVPCYPVSWWREHTEVKAWAYIVYAPEGWAIAETWEEFEALLVRIRARVGWFYNAPFDFSVLDYDMLSRGWEHVGKASKTPRQYSELSNDFGARYSMTCTFPYHREKGDRSKRTTWKTTFYDLRNIFGGGLAQLLRDFDVRDADGTPIRKLEMDYQAAQGSDSDLEYMKADAAGLWWLIDKAGGRMCDLYGLDIRCGKPDILTASTLAKRVVFAELYPHVQSWQRQRQTFARYHPMNYQLDQTMRAYGLLGGGRVMLNPAIKGKHLEGIKANRYDFNSEYPAYMANMLSVIGRPEAFPTYDDAREWYPETSCFIYVFDELRAILRDGMIPSFRNPFTGNIDAFIDIQRGAGPIALFKEEFDELFGYWYDLDHFRLREVITFPTTKEHAIERVMRREYARKTEAKLTGDKALSSFSKLVMNGYGGKYSQNPNRDVITRVLDGHVQKRCIGEEKDEKALMQVVQGARITAGGRCMLLRACRDICGREVSDRLLYTDTDSIHAIGEAPHTSETELGALKRENKTPIVRACFLAPKTYYEIEESGKIEIHAKGVRTSDIEALIKRGVPIETIYREGYRVQSLSALNVRGGKALLPLPKVLCRETDINHIDERFD